MVAKALEHAIWKDAAMVVVCIVMLCVCNSTASGWQAYSMVQTPSKPQQQPVDLNFSDSAGQGNAIQQPGTQPIYRSVVGHPGYHHPPTNNQPYQTDQRTVGNSNDPIFQSQDTQQRIPIDEFPPQPFGTNGNGSNGSNGVSSGLSNGSQTDGLPNWLRDVRVGYDGGFVVANESETDLNAGDSPFQMRLNGWGQLRHTVLDSANTKPDQNQFQLKRARIVLSGHAFTSDFNYFFQLDGRSSSGDDIRLLDYFLSYDIGRHSFGLDRGRIGFRTGRWKMPFTMSRYLSGREFEFTDRSVSSMFFDVNRSLGWGLYGSPERFFLRRFDWEVAVFNGLVTGGAETGSSGTLDDNFAYSGRIFWYPTGDWGNGELADLDYHCCLATRIGAGYANSTIDSIGSTEFNRIRVVDSGERLSDILVGDISQYTVNLWTVNGSMKYRGWSVSMEYYFRLINDFEGMGFPQPDLFDHGHWLQIGKFVVPGKFQLLARWSRVVGNSGTLGGPDQSSDERSGGFAWYFREQNAKLVLDATYLDGAPISSAALDIEPGDAGWLIRSQIQFAF